jgi:dihydrofolate reductase
MGKVTTRFTMSLDGFVAESDDSVERLFGWYTLGGAEHDIATGDHAIRMNSEGARIIAEAQRTMGALVAGRRLFEHTRGWGGRHPIAVPIFVVTHRLAPEWAELSWPVTYVQDGVESAIRQAQAIAGEKAVAIASPTIAQQCLNAGLLDEIVIDLAPALLTHGVRLFDHLATGPLALEQTQVDNASGAVHLTYRVIK